MQWGGGGGGMLRNNKTMELKQSDCQSVIYILYELSFPVYSLMNEIGQVSK